jgi:hypothetical protein
MWVINGIIRRTEEYVMTANTDELTTIDDVVSYLKDQHSTIKEILPSVLQAEGEDRATAFAKVRQTLAIHEALEQVVIHPHAKPDAGKEEVVERVDEEEEAGEAITKLEGFDISSKEFHDGYAAFMLDVIEHAEHEEHEEFDAIRKAFDDDELAKIHAAVELANSAAEDPPAGSSFEDMLADAKETISGAKP